MTGPLGFIAAGLLLARYRSTTPTFVMIGVIATVAAGLAVIALTRGRRIGDTEATRRRNTSVV